LAPPFFNSPTTDVDGSHLQTSPEVVKNIRVKSFRMQSTT